MALEGVELLLPGGAGEPRSGMFRVFSIDNVVCCVFSSSSVLIAFVATRQLCRWAIRTNTQCGSQICRLSRASGVIVVVSGPSMVSVVFRIGALLVVLQQWLLVASVRRTFLFG